MLIVNPSSGDGGADELLAAARARGIATHVLADGDDLERVARDADAGALGMAGGDGSLAVVAAVAIERALPFVCRATRRRRARQRPTVPEQRLARRLRPPRPPAGAPSTAPERARAAARARRRRPHRHEIGLTIEGDPVTARVVLVANNAYDLSVLSLGEREHIDDGRLHVYAARSLLRSDWKEQSSERVTIDTPTHRVRAAVDGEPEVLRTPLEFRLEPLALRVLVPREQNRRDATKEDRVDNPEPTETEEELAQTERQEEEEEDMRGTTDPEEQD